MIKTAMNIIEEAKQKAFSYSGYEREAGLRTLLQHNSPNYYSIYWSRINDWVPQVQRLAEQGIRQLAEENSAILLTQLTALLQLKNYRRRDHSALFEFLANLLRSPSVLEAISNELINAKSNISWKHLSLVKSQTLLTSEQLLHLATKGTSPALSSEASRILLFNLAKPDTDLLLTLAQGKHRNVKIQALKKLFRCGYAFPSPTLHNLLLSENAGLRHLAQEQSDFTPSALIEYYENTMQTADSKKMLAAIQELQRLDWRAAEYFMPNLKNHTNDRLRLEYWKFQLTHGQTSKLALISEGLKDSSGKVIRECIKYYMSSTDFFSPIGLLTIETNLAPDRAINWLVLLLRKHNKWEQLHFWLSMMHIYLFDPDKQAHIHKRVRACMAPQYQPYTKLSTQSKQALQETIQMLSGDLTEELVIKLKRTIDSALT